MNSRDRVADRHALEARLGARLAGSLTLQAQAVPHDVAERLRFARERALVRARESRQAPAVVGLTGAGAAVLAGLTAPWWQRAAAVLPLLLLVLGLLAIDHWTARESIMAAADIDAQLLADNLPPTAYSDPGFAEYLRTAPPQ